ncbi:MAG: hypothetical protein WBS24_10015 [Terriglobales bacterium]
MSVASSPGAGGFGVAPGCSAGACGIAALDSCAGAGIEVPPDAPGGVADGDKGGAGGFGTVCMPGTFGIEGTRGKDSSSLSGGNTGWAVGDAPFSPSERYGVEPGTAGALPGETVVKSAPAGEAPGAEDGTPAMPGNENILSPEGIVGARANGEAFASARKPGGTPETAGTVPGLPRTNAVEPANEEEMARKSVSVSGPG